MRQRAWRIKLNLHLLKPVLLTAKARLTSAPPFPHEFTFTIRKKSWLLHHNVGVRLREMIGKLPRNPVELGHPSCNLQPALCLKRNQRLARRSGGWPFTPIVEGETVRIWSTHGNTGVPKIRFPTWNYYFIHRYVIWISCFHALSYVQLNSMLFQLPHFSVR